MAILDDTREDWNARQPLRARTSVPWVDRLGVSWHWIGPGRGPSAAGSHSACLKQVRDWQAQHQAQGWKDIGYNALICQHARAIEGRGLTYAGSHSPGVNYAHVGVQFMVGQDTPGGATPAMLARAVKLRADIGALGRNIRRDWGHRDDPKASTACPGDALYKWVHSGGPTATTTTQEDDSMSAADVQALKDWIEEHDADVFIRGFSVDKKDYAGMTRIAIENQRRITRIEGAVQALASGLGPQVQEAVRQALSADYDAKVELTPKATTGGAA